MCVYVCVCVCAPVACAQSGLQNARKSHIPVAAVAHGSDSHVRAREGPEADLDPLLLIGDVKVCCLPLSPGGLFFLTRRAEQEWALTTRAASRAPCACRGGTL